MSNTNSVMTNEDYRISVSGWMDKEGTTLSRAEYLQRWEVCTINDLYSLAVFGSGLDSEVEELRAMQSKFEDLKSAVLYKHFNDRARSTLTGAHHPLAQEK